jgi:hypothetical protein
MIQLNLLPDIKLQYIRAARMRSLALALSLIVSLGSLGLLALLLSLNALQTKHLNDLNKDIDRNSSSIRGQDDIDRILTVQNQLNSLSTLHSSKPTASRLTGYLNQVTPSKVNINNVSADFTTTTISVSGTADSLARVNQYVDTLKFTNYTTKEVKDSKKAFSAVVLASFNLSENEASFSITLTYDPVIFDITQTVSLTVPKQVTTRSQVDQPSELFVLPVDPQKPATGKVN